MLLALAGKMPESLLAISNAIDLAKTRPTDDPLSLSRAYDMMGRTLLEMKETGPGISSLLKAQAEFRRLQPRGASELQSVTELLSRTNKP
jgi:hypothetical protein